MIKIEYTINSQGNPTGVVTQIHITMEAPVSHVEVLDAATAILMLQNTDDTELANTTLEIAGGPPAADEVFSSLMPLAQRYGLDPRSFDPTIFGPQYGKH